MGDIGRGQALKDVFLKFGKLELGGEFVDEDVFEQTIVL